MAANKPIAVRPAASCPVVCTKPVANVAAPMPTKKIAIMLRQLQRSPSQPAGNEPAPNAMKPPSASAISSLYGLANVDCMLKTAVGKISMNM